MKKAGVLSYRLSAQADLSLCWVHCHFVGFVMRRLICFFFFLVPLEGYDLSHIMRKCLWGMWPCKTQTGPKLKRLARFLKFGLQQVEVLYYLSSEQQRCWSDCADVRIKQVFSWHAHLWLWLFLRIFYNTYTERWQSNWMVKTPLSA